MHTALWKTNCSTICIEIIRSQLLEQGWMLIVLWLPRNNTALIWSKHNLDLIEDNCDPHCSEDRILCTVYTGTCPPSVHPHHSNRRFRLATSSDTQHQMLTKSKEFWIECLEYLGKAFPIILLMVHFSLIFVLLKIETCFLSGQWNGTFQFH